MKKKVLGIIVVLVAFVLVSCHKKETIKEKNIYYKVYSEKDSLIGFALRKYVFNSDTISEKYISISLEGNKKYDYKRLFHKIGGDIFIFSNIKDDDSKSLYFSPTKKDTCFHIDNKLENFYICKKGKVNFKNYKNVYKVYYDERGYDSRKETLILDIDYTILARFEDCYNYRKEVIMQNNEVDKDLKIKFEKAEKQILWW